MSSSGRSRLTLIVPGRSAMAGVILGQFVADFATTFKAADALRPAAMSARSGLTYGGPIGAAYGTIQVF
jgi:hypothetical protein